MGGNMGRVDMIPISTVNLVNSVEGEKKKSDHPLKIRTVTGGYRGSHGRLTELLMLDQLILYSVDTALVIWENLKYIKMTL